MVDARTPYHRGCTLDRVIACRCGDDVYYDYLHNACIAPNKYIPQEYKYAVRKTLERLVSSNFQDTQCRTREVHESPYFEKLASKDQLVTGDIIMTISPYLANWDYITSVYGGQGSSDWAGGLAGRIEEDLRYDVELTTTVERRLRCSSLRKTLFECDLVECAPGAIMWPDPQPKPTFNNSLTCLPARLVTVRQWSELKADTICACLRVVAALNKLQIWRLQIRPSPKNNVRCHVDLYVPHKENETVLTSHDAFGEADFVKRYSRLSEARPSFYQQFQDELFQSENLCEVPGIETVLVCFFGHAEEESFPPEQCYFMPLARGEPVNTAISPRGNYEIEKQRQCLLSIDLYDVVIYRHKAFSDPFAISVPKYGTTFPKT
ncbi:hypothetical protein EGW08_023542 [Elysia chlorotica]|uniref:Uncharacterized protein n=1 Tax=Elysia chlorotica TaxID=188477 RepID=A0A3S1AVV5_ELYCH|nr:hypothetical protein EGW08_023542 [Elysia chlorotica]